MVWNDPCKHVGEAQLDTTVSKARQPKARSLFETCHRNNSGPFRRAFSRDRARGRVAWKIENYKRRQASRFVTAAARENSLFQRCTLAVTAQNLTLRQMLHTMHVGGFLQQES